MLSNPSTTHEDGPQRFPQPLAPRPARSAGMLVWGILTLLIGQAVYQAGQQQMLMDATSRSSENDGGALVLVGAVLCLAGLVWLLTGVHRLARGVDQLVQESAWRAAAAFGSPPPAPDHRAPGPHSLA